MESKRYRCLLCGRDKFTRKTPHHCNTGYRKHNIKWEEFTIKKQTNDMENKIDYIRLLKAITITLLILGGVIGISWLTTILPPKILGAIIFFIFTVSSILVIVWFIYQYHTKPTTNEQQ